MMPCGDFPDPEGMIWSDASGWITQALKSPLVLNADKSPKTLRQFLNEIRAMTGQAVSEAEIEAVARAIAIADDDEEPNWDSLLPYWREYYCKLARAALTAAAQVRERAGKRMLCESCGTVTTDNTCDCTMMDMPELQRLIPEPGAEDFRAELCKSLGRELRFRNALKSIADLPDVRCDEAPNVARNALNDGTRAPPVATEPDYGPSVLGIKRGEE